MLLNKERTAVYRDQTNWERVKNLRNSWRNRVLLLSRLKKDKYSFETISFSLASQEKMNAKEVVCIN